jgi:hypothetical protein
LPFLLLNPIASLLPYMVQKQILPFLLLNPIASLLPYMVQKQTLPFLLLNNRLAIGSKSKLCLFYF